MELDKKDKARMYGLRGSLKVNNDLLAKSDWVISKRKKAKLAEKNKEIEEELNEFRIKYDDPDIDTKAYEDSIEGSIFTKIGNNLDKVGTSMQSTGKGMVKAGMHTTAAVWTPAIYLGYRGVKHVRNKPKNESVEQDLIELINEVEKAHKDGKITEAQKKEYVLDFVDNYYR